MSFRARPSCPPCAAPRGAGWWWNSIVDQESNKPLVQLAQQSYYDVMLKSGVRILRHTGSFLHAKHLSIDDEVALIGSSNLDIRSFALNAEVSVLIYDRVGGGRSGAACSTDTCSTRRWSPATNVASYPSAAERWRISRG